MADHAEPENPHEVTDGAQATPSPASVFISYASHDVGVATALVEVLERNGLTCWIAPRDVRPGALYADAIVRAISGARALVLVLSESSIESSHVGKEIERASSKRRPIIALRIDAAPLTPALEYFLSESQWVEAQAENRQAAYAKLVDAVRGSAPAAPATGSSVPSAVPALGTPLKSRYTRILVAAAVAIIVAYLVVDKFWLSRQVVEQTPVAAAVSANAPAPPAISEKSIAVLPFLDMSEKHDQEYFSDGLAEELLDLLSRTPGLRVIARTSSFYFKGKQASLTEIAKTLNVANLLEGSVRKSGNRLRVTTQLIRADTGQHLWSESYDRDLKDVFQVQDDIAAAVVKALRTTLLVSSPENRTKNIEAYTLFLQGRSLANQASATDERKATQVLRRAVELDPSYSSAWAALANVLFELSAYTDSGQDVDADMKSARIAVQRALELDPGNASAYYLRATIRIVYDHDPKGAIADIEAARRSDPNSTKPTELVLVAGCSSGPCFEQYIREISRDIELDPLNANTIQIRGWAYWIAGNLTASLADLHRALELSPGFETANYNIACVLLAEHRLPEALKAAQAEANSLFRRESIALVYFAMGRRAEAESMLNELLANDATEGQWNIAEVYAFAGNKSAALDWLERDYESHRSGVLYLGVDPFFKPLISEPRFVALLRNIGMTDTSAP
jgi:adenylate cyclase